MAEQQDEKPRLPLAGLAILVTMIGGLLVYQDFALKTSRPVDKEKTNHLSLDKDQVQARLWQDPFEAVVTYRINEQKRSSESGKTTGPATINDLSINDFITRIKESIGTSREVRILPVFVDGSPYSSGAESRLNDRYALISALGAAGYVPESGDHIHVFRWDREEERKKTARQQRDESSVLVPVELFHPKAKIRDEPYGKQVLVLWLKAQDFSEKPLQSLNALLEELNRAFIKTPPEIKPMYRILGPRFSTGLSAMVKELQAVQAGDCIPQFRQLNDAKFYSPWATADGTFLLDYSLDPPDLDQAGNVKETGRTVKEIFECAGIDLTRTIKTDTVLAEQLFEELKRRAVDLQDCPANTCKHRVALISEWDTLYGRSLPRIFAAVVQNNGLGKSPGIGEEVNKLREDEWPDWVSRYSYLMGLDGELPARTSDMESGPTQATNLLEHQNQQSRQMPAEMPEGRSQLDYVRRLALSLKQEQEQRGEEFRAIGVLGSDVYDKLLILQALRPIFPRAIFFTTDLNARLTHPSQWQWTRNLIVASHFGLELQQDLQTPIPPFRDSYQTSLFYASLWALDHFRSPGRADYFQLRMGEDADKKFSRNTDPRLYEVGRHGAFDISPGANSASGDYSSIHPPRPDLNSDPWQSLKRAGLEFITVISLILAAMLTSSVAANVFTKLAWKLFGMAIVIGTICYGLVLWIRWTIPNVAENEPFVLNEGISAWPTVVIRLFAIAMTLVFLRYSWQKLKDNEKALARAFGFEDKDKLADRLDSIPLIFSARFLDCCVGLHRWHPQAGGQIDAALLWWRSAMHSEIRMVAARIVPQVAIAFAVAWLLLELFGFPYIPCRGEACAKINYVSTVFSSVAMLVLIFYVIDATRICLKWVDCIGMGKVLWSDGTRLKIAKERGVSEKNLDEWLGIELIAERTALLGKFIYFPFIIMLLLGVARHTYLDNWDFSTALVIIFTLSAILIFLNSMLLRRSAETAKWRAIERLEARLIGLSDQTPDERKEKRQIEWVIAAIKNNRRGAFLPFTQHPVFGAAIALPSGAYGIVLLLEYLATSF
ncbi:hypothetical protein [Nitrosospira briensis]|uniref:hypothetical protein n=1 Tax=Nitrosospira briensis TaxID=35799 RepID=UPI0008EB0B9C|nr:hypothetical protein [Nitrosospira briensis]SFN76698.1 hypothetical protein SAMN05216332_101540 [Nitrosospira briensis]